MMHIEKSSCFLCRRNKYIQSCKFIYTTRIEVETKYNNVIRVQMHEITWNVYVENKLIFYTKVFIFLYPKYKKQQTHTEWLRFSL